MHHQQMGFWVQQARFDQWDDVVCPRMYLDLLYKCCTRKPPFWSTEVMLCRGCRFVDQTGSFLLAWSYAYDACKVMLCLLDQNCIFMAFMEQVRICWLCRGSCADAAFAIFTIQLCNHPANRLECRRSLSGGSNLINRASSVLKLVGACTSLFWDGICSGWQVP